MRISDINTDNNTVNLSMVPAGAYDDRSGGGYGEITISFFGSCVLAVGCCPACALVRSSLTCLAPSIVGALL